MKVGIYTSFYSWDTAYSLVSVVESQLQGLVANGYEAVLFVHDNFKADGLVPKGVEIRKVVPRFLLIDYSANQQVTPELEEQAQKAYEALKKYAGDIDVMFSEDMIFQGWFLPYCMAIHKYAPEAKTRWYHWTHSVPNPPPAGLGYPHILRYKLPANSKLVYLNNFHMVRAAEAYGVYPKDVRVVYNSMDPRLFGAKHPLVVSLLTKYPILEADLVQIYPLSTTRMIDGKGLKILIEIFAELKKLGRKVALIVPNAHANDKREKQVIAETMSFAATKGLSQNELIFTSLEDTPTYELGVPREVISQLFPLSNLFIFPSTSENCSLILLEAMLAKCLLVLNDNVGAMREFGGTNALYFKFGGLGEQVDYQNREAYLRDVAKIIISEFENNKVLKAQVELRKNFNYQAIFERQILPLLHET